MKRGPFFSSLVGVAIGWAAPGCSGDEFTATSNGGDAAEGGEPSGGNSGASGGGASGSDSGGGPNGGSAGSSTGGASTGGDAGEPSGGNNNGGNGNGGVSGTAGMPSGGTGGGGVSGMAGRAGSGGTMGGASGSGGSVGGGSGGKAGSGATAGKGGTAGTAGSGGTAGTAGTAGTGGAMQAGCPPNSPALGSNCNTSNYCMYGTHPLVTCRQILDCVAGHWQERQPSCGTPLSCSASSEPPIVGEGCSNDGFQCLADQNVFCMCASNCTTVCSVPVWHCFGPQANCPPLLPNHGQPCSGAMSCTYGTCPSGTSTVASCENGAWRLREGNCPQ